MPWHYPASIWVLSSPDSEGWTQHHGELIYCDDQIGRLKTDDGIFEGPINCISVQTPLNWFLPLYEKQPQTSGRYGYDFPREGRRVVQPIRLSPRSSKGASQNDEEEIFG